MLGATVENSSNFDINGLVDFYLQYSTIRNEELFRAFLPIGYRATSLSTARVKNLEKVVWAKMHLGMLITLMDDLADNPMYKNPQLLEKMYCLFDFNQNQLEEAIHNGNGVDKGLYLAQVLVLGLHRSLESLPQVDALKDLFNFDLKQIVLANCYSELITSQPGLANLSESVYHGAYNMGMVAAGTIDLMGSGTLSSYKIGACREVFLLGQRFGRICNILTTFEREKKEGDLTNEMSIYLRMPNQGRASLNGYREALKEEMDRLLVTIKGYQKSVSFNVDSYVKGLRMLYKLHKALEGVI